jgi:hypothetical protein
MTKFIRRFIANPVALIRIAAILILLPISLKAQDTLSFLSSEKKVTALCNKIWKSKDDTSRLAANTAFLEEYQSILSQPSAFDYPFDSLTGISRLRSDDGKIRITTWDVPLMDGSLRYFGFMETKDGQLVRLQESSSKPMEWNNQIVNYNQWYGAVYYKLITLHNHKEVFYTLLGWDGNDAGSNMKIIDILSLGSDGRPQFGKPVFKSGAEIRNRVVVEYSENANVLLRYDYQSLMLKKGKRVKEKKAWMIVTDRLVPQMPTMEGIHKFYVPAGDTYDAYIFIKGFWTFVEDVKVANKTR